MDSSTSTAVILLIVYIVLYNRKAFWKMVVKPFKRKELKEASLRLLRAAGLSPMERLAQRRASSSFYQSRAWQRLRYRALRLCGAKCQCCGADRKTTKLHVDHIKPRSKFPELELDIKNLQVLCENCNMGKSNIDATDWR